MDSKVLRTFALLFLFGTNPVPSTAQLPLANEVVRSEVVRINLKFAPKGERRPVPFELLNGLFVFKANVNGQQIWAMLDNGMSESLIDETLVRDQKITLGPPLGPLMTASGSLARRRVYGIPVEIPGQIRFTAPMSAVNLAFLKRATGRTISLVVGKEYFANLELLILSQRRTFQMGPSGSLKLPPDTQFAALKGNLPQVEVEVGGRKLNVMLDFGANGNLHLNSNAWMKLGLGAATAREGKGANLQGGFYKVRHSQVSRMSVGPFTKAPVEISFFPTLPHAEDGLLGLGFLSNFDFAIDVKAGKLWMLGPVKSPVPSSIATP